MIGALSTSLSQLNPDGRVDLNITSAAAGVTRHYDSAPVMQHDVIDARVWSGIHFRTADEVGCTLGTQVANWSLEHYFAPRKEPGNRAGRRHRVPSGSPPSPLDSPAMRGNATERGIPSAEPARPASI